MNGLWLRIAGGGVLCCAGAMIWLRLAPGKENGEAGLQQPEQFPVGAYDGRASGRHAGFARRAEGGPPLSRSAAQSLAEPWIEDAMQDDDPERRAEALDAIRKALEGRDELENYAALLAFTGIRDIGFPQETFRAAIERHLNAFDFGMQRAAWYALFHSDPQRDDIPRIWELADRPGIQAAVAHLLTMWEGGDLTRTSGSVVEELLHHEDPRVLRETLRGVWGGSFSGELSERIVELTRHPDEEVAHNAVHHALSTQANKTGAGIERLLELATAREEDAFSGRAAWGLREGVPEEFHSQVADVAIELIETREDGLLRDAAMDLVMRYSGEAHRPALELLVTEPGIDPLLQEELIEAIAELDR